MADDDKIWRPGEVEEPEVAYDTGLHDVDDLISRIREGLEFNAFSRLQERLDLTERDLASLLGISSTTLARRKVQNRLTPEESERAVRFARLFELAGDVFEEEADRRNWLKTPRAVFGGESPLQRASTEIGARQVEDVLGRIEYGVYS